MKTKFLLPLLAIAASASAKNYYISSSGDDSQNGLTTATAWRTISKLNAALGAINPGDSVLFKRGDTFFGGISLARSGSASSPIVFSAYGTGAKPLISGFVTLSGWTNAGGNVWRANVASASSSLLVVTIDGNLQRLGRYPNPEATNSGYLSYTAISSTAPSITGTELSTTTNWTGAEVVIRKNHWILDRCRVTAHNGGELVYTNPSGYTGKTGGYGYFLQDDIRTLDQYGEWFLDKSTKNLSVFFGSETPSTHTVKASIVDRLLNLNSSNYVNVSNLSFEGANTEALYVNYAQNVNVTNCSFNNNTDAVDATILNAVVSNDSISNTLNTAIGLADWGSSYAGTVVISSNYIKNVGLFAGMSGSGDGMLNGIRQLGANATIEYNRIENSGYQGIVFEGNNTKVRYNFISGFCSVKDDGAGIYTGSVGDLTARSNRIVSNNIIMNGIGATYGTPNFATPGATYDAHGIYLDENTNGVVVINNSIANLPQGSGIFINVGLNLQAKNNTLYNVRNGLRIDRMPNKPLVRNIAFASNIVYPSVSNFRYWNGSLNYPVTTDIQSDVKAIFAKMDSNFYRNDVVAPFDWFYHTLSGGTYVDAPALYFSDWQRFVNAEGNSAVMSTTVPIFEYNASNVSKTTALDAKYADATGATFNAGSITLSPYTSKLLFKTGPLDPDLIVDAGTDVSVSMPIDSTVLRASATVSNVTYVWTKKTGPTQFIIKTPTNAQTVIDSLTTGTYTFQVKATDQLGRIAIDTVVVTARPGIVPVRLLNFSARKDNERRNAVNWITTSEENSSYFTVERGSTSSVFESIGQVRARNITNFESSYNFSDNTPFAGNNYYRLKMVDKDGSFKYSPVVLVSRNKIQSLVIENIALSIGSGKMTMNVQSSEMQDIAYAVYSANGVQMAAKSFPLQQGTNSIINNLSGVQNAVYFVKITSKTGTETRKVVAMQ